MNLEMKSWWNEELHLYDNFQTNPQMNISNQRERRLSYSIRSKKVCAREIKEGRMSKSNSWVTIFLI